MLGPRIGEDMRIIIYDTTIGRTMDWTKLKMLIAALLWKIITRNQVVKSEINEILHEQT